MALTPRRDMGPRPTNHQPRRRLAALVGLTALGVAY
jgi:hypothetical protein